MKKILITGSNGFLGRNIINLLKNEGYEITNLDIDDADIKSNIRKEIPLINNHFNIVLHAAGKAHSIPKTEEEKRVFFDTNYQGTINLCRALEKSGVPRSFIFISTVAVYGCDFGDNISEDHPLEGTSPYALSKILAEQFLLEWCKKNNVILTILRPSLIAGPNPPGNLGDMIKGIRKSLYFSINGGDARKSVLMVDDIALLIPLVEEKGGIYNVCDDENPSFKQLEILISNQLGKKTPPNIPYWIVKPFSLVGDILGKKSPINSSKLLKMTKSLTFSNQKAKDVLGWQPLNILKNFRISI